MIVTYSVDNIGRSLSSHATLNIPFYSLVRDEIFRLSFFKNGNMKTRRKIDKHDFSGCGNTFFLYQFVNRNGRATELVCPLADEYINGERNFQFVFQKDALTYRDSSPALKNSFVNRIPADDVDFILEIDPN